MKAVSLNTNGQLRRDGTPRLAVALLGGHYVESALE